MEEDVATSDRRLEELRSFLFLTVVMAPALTVIDHRGLRLPGLDVPAHRRAAHRRLT